MNWSKDRIKFYASNLDRIDICIKQVFEYVFQSFSPYQQGSSGKQNACNTT